MLEAARNRGYLRYAQAGAIVGLDMENPADREEISRLLDEVSESEYSEGRPLLSAVVIHARDNIPGNGFFVMAQRVGRFAGDDRLRFWLAEIEAVYQQWAGGGDAQ